MRQIGLIFHGIGSALRPLADGEARYWLTTSQFDTALDCIQACPRPDRIRISFDDGNLSDHDIALPRLLARGLTASFFVLSGRIGQPGSLDAGQIRTLQDRGMSIGSHGVHHLDWRRATAAGLQTDLTESRTTLEEICGRPVKTAAIPFGSYDQRVLKALQKAGYACAFSSDRGSMNPDSFLRPRSSLTGHMSCDRISSLCEGRMSPPDRLRRLLGMTMKRLG